jgi:hypothetical protein
MGVEAFIAQIRDELVRHTYKPLPARKKEIRKYRGKVRVLSIPRDPDRECKVALKLILEPIFEVASSRGEDVTRTRVTNGDRVFSDQYLFNQFSDDPMSFTAIERFGGRAQTRQESRKRFRQAQKGSTALRLVVIDCNSTCIASTRPPTRLGSRVEVTIKN